MVIGFAGVVPLRADIAEITLQQVSDDTFAALKTNSPFRRSIGINDTIVLTGIARIQNDVVATLFDTGTSESYLVSKTVNREGWRLVGVKGDESDLDSLTAKIQVTGGELVSIRYEKLPQESRKPKSGSRSSSGSSQLSSSQMKQAKYYAINYKGEHPADGFGRLPPPEVVSKLSRMTVQQRESLNRDMLQLLNKGVGSEARRKIYVQKIDKSLQGRR